MLVRRKLRTLASVLLIAIAALYLISEAEPAQVAQTALVVPQSTPEIRIDEYGIEVTRSKVVERTVRSGSTFSDLLTEFGLSMEQVGRAADASAPVFDIRRLRAGRPYHVYLEKNRARYLVYEEDQRSYLVFDLSDAPTVARFQRPVTVERRTINARINSSLYGSLAAAGADAALASRLAEVYAWQIDFYRLQKGDEFSVLFEEEQVGGETIGVGKVIAARFVHAGEDYYAFGFDQDGVTDFFDENGESLRKAFLKAPLKFSRISSGYSLRRFHPVQKRFKAHLGTDYAAPTGTPIHATGDAVVLDAGYSRGNGNYVKLRHNGTYDTGYLHMSKIGAGIRKGVRVHQGEVIGYVGSTGLATGPHVCYRFWKNGRQIDPLKEVFPSANPIKEDEQEAFMAVRQQLMPSLTLAAETERLALAR